MSFSVHQENDSMTGFDFTHDDQTALDSVLQILGHQIAAGNAPAGDFGKCLRLLDSNLESLQATLQSAVSLGSVDLSFLAPEALFDMG